MSGTGGARWKVVAEAAAVLALPGVAFVVWHLRLMAPQDYPDPSLMTAYVVHPRDEVARLYTALERSGRDRDGARVGLLLLARPAYLLFGPVGGFAATRYVLALVAVVPTYTGLRRRYDRAAALTGAVVVLSNPVIVTAWGTDYTDSAAVSYLLGGLACLTLGAPRRAWLVAGAALLSLALWSNAITAPLVAVILVVHCWHQRHRAAADLVVAAAVFVAVTVLLAGGSWLLLGRFDIVTPTIRGIVAVGGSATVAASHSASWRWAPYADYLLVPVAVIGAWAASPAARRGSDRAIGAVCVGQVAVFVLLQFAGDLWTLEYHYFSSLLWAATALLLTVTLVELAGPLRRPATAWVLPVVVAVVPLAYEAHPVVLRGGWLPWGAVVAAGCIGVAVAGPAAARYAVRSIRGAAVLTVLAVTAGTLALTVARSTHPRLAGTVGYPSPAYAAALGGSDHPAVDEYRVEAALPTLVGPATFPDEQVLMWTPPYRPAQATALLGPIGMYHSYFDSLPATLPTLTGPGRARLTARRPAEVVLLGFSGAAFPAAVRSLAAYGPVVRRRGILRSGSYRLVVTVVTLERFSD